MSLTMLSLILHPTLSIPVRHQLQILCVNQFVAQVRYLMRECSLYLDNCVFILVSIYTNTV